MNVDELLISQPDTGEQALEIADMLIRSGALDVIVIDSVAALVPRAEIEGEMGDTHVGLQARLMSQALRKLTGNLNKSRTICIFINQLREKIGVMFGSPETTPGGRALKFYSSVRLDIRRIESIKDGAEVIGNRTRVKVVKNKVAPPFKQAEFDIMYGKGISREGSLLDVGVDLGIVKKSGAWFTYEGEQLGQGRENAKTFLSENLDMMVEISEKVRKEVRHRRRAEPRSTPRSTAHCAEPKSARDRLTATRSGRDEPRAVPARCVSAAGTAEDGGGARDHGGDMVSTVGRSQRSSASAVEMRLAQEAARARPTSIGGSRIAELQLLAVISPVERVRGDRSVGAGQEARPSVARSVCGSRVLVQEREWWPVDRRRRCRSRSTRVPPSSAAATADPIVDRWRHHAQRDAEQDHQRRRRSPSCVGAGPVTIGGRAGCRARAEQEPAARRSQSSVWCSRTASVSVHRHADERSSRHRESPGSTRAMHRAPPGGSIRSRWALHAAPRATARWPKHHPADVHQQGRAPQRATVSERTLECTARAAPGGGAP